jgi:hypothetical protein
MKKILFILFAILIANAQEIPEISKDTKGAVPEKDINQLYCLMTKWKSQDFFIPLSIDVPEFKEIYVEGQVKLNAICSAQNHKEGEDAVSELIKYSERAGELLSGINIANLQDKIKQVTVEKKEEYATYKKQATEKRKQIILTTLDTKVKETSEQIRAIKNLNNAKKYIAELQDDRNIVGDKIQQAFDNANEEQLNTAISELKTKWSVLKEKIDKDLATEYKSAEICSTVIPQLKKINSSAQIDAIKDKCSKVTEDTPFDEELINLLISLRNELRNNNL